MYDDLLKLDAAIFTDPALMPGVERITYQPAGGSPRAINAQVFRATPDETPDGVTFKTSVFVSRADVPVLSVGGDRVSLNDQKGKPRTHRVASIIREDAGGYELTLE